MPRRSARDWDKIARLYESGEPSVAAICAAFGISRSTLYQRARAMGWRRRRGREARGGARAAAKGGAPASGGRASRAGKPGGDARMDERGRLGARRAVLRRLYRAMERQLAEIEERMAMREDSSPASAEREARALGALVRAFEKLTAFDERLRQAGEAADARAGKGVRGGARDGDGEQDAERLRRDIARRIAALGGDGHAG